MQQGIEGLLRAWRPLPRSHVPYIGGIEFRMPAASKLTPYLVIIQTFATLNYNMACKQSNVYIYFATKIKCEIEF